jgi:hypothetical protein
MAGTGSDRGRGSWLGGGWVLHGLHRIVLVLLLGKVDDRCFGWVCGLKNKLAVRLGSNIQFVEGMQNLNKRDIFSRNVWNVERCSIRIIAGIGPCAGQSAGVGGTVRIVACLCLWFWRWWGRWGRWYGGDVGIVSRGRNWRRSWRWSSD